MLGFAAAVVPPPVLRAHNSWSSVLGVHYSPAALVAGRRRHFPWPAAVVVDLRLLRSVVALAIVVAGNQERHSSWRTGQESVQIGAKVAEAVEGPSFVVVVGEPQERPFGRIDDWTGTAEEDHHQNSYAAVVGSCPPVVVVAVGLVVWDYSHPLIVPEEGRYCYWSLW